MAKKFEEAPADEPKKTCPEGGDGTAECPTTDEQKKEGEGEQSSGGCSCQGSGEGSTEPKKEGEQQQSRGEFNRFRDAFADKASDYYAAGLTFSQAQERYSVHLREENAKLKQQLGAASHAEGEAKPIGLSPQGDGTRKGSGFASKIRIK